MPGFQKVTLDDVDITADVLAGDQFSIELSRDETTKTVVFALTSDLELTGDAYQTLVAKFIPNCFSCNNKLSIKIIPDCCDIELEFELLVEGVSFDFINCTVRVTALQQTGATKAFKYLDSHVWWKDGDGRLITDDIVSPKVVYFRDPTWWQTFTGIFRNWGNTKYHFYHPCPIAYDVLRWNAGRVGLTFKSESIFLAFQEYRFMSLMYAQNRTGPNVGENYNFIADNWPIETPLELLDNLSLVFNADFRIFNNELRFETFQWYEMNAFVIEDFQTLIDENRILEFGGASVDASKNSAYGRFEYENDSIDTFCNRNHWYYSDFIEWNPTGMNECLRGELSNGIQYGPTLIIGDHAYNEMIRDFNSSDDYEDIRSDNPDGKLFMNDGSAQWPKLIIVPVNWQSTGYVTPMNRTNPAGELETGWQLSFREDEPDGLYNRFHAYRDPARTSTINLGDIKYSPENFCLAVDIVKDRGIEIALSTQWGKGIPESIELNFGEQTITMKNVVVVCEF